MRVRVSSKRERERERERERPGIVNEEAINRIE